MDDDTLAKLTAQLEFLEEYIRTEKANLKSKVPLGLQNAFFFLGVLYIIKNPKAILPVAAYYLLTKNTTTTPTPPTLPAAA